MKLLQRITGISRWAPPVAVIALAALVRMAGLEHPHEIVFDETYYLKDAYTLGALGYEARWPENANDQILAGQTDIYLQEGAFVVHPPLGKWIIAAGIALFGTESAFGWRSPMAVVGILLVGLTMLLTHTLFRSGALTTLAGFLLAIDGNAIVLSRVALLDNGVAFFCLLGALFVCYDRKRFSREPKLWNRPWLLGATIAFGLGASVKWNAIYLLAFFAVYTVVADVWARHRAGISVWLSLLRHVPVNFLLLIPLAGTVYLLSWAGWFLSDGGYYRHWSKENSLVGALASWWHYQGEIMSYHLGEDTPHSYQANPLSWLLLIRPTSMFYHNTEDGRAEAILDIANPLIWWGGAVALIFFVVRIVSGLLRRTSVASEAFIFIGFAAGYLPWLLYLNRTVFQFYTIIFEPYLVIALAAALLSLSQKSTANSESLRWVTISYLALVVAVSLFFLPLWTGMSVPIWFHRLHYWLPSWI